MSAGETTGRNAERYDVKIIGLTGSLGSGKSTVAGFFEKLGCTVIDADVLAREVIQPGTEGYRQVVKHFGTEILNADGTIDRHRLAGIVFVKPEELKALNEIVHPRVLALQKERISRCGKDDIVILNIPLLFESKLEDTMDAVIVVTVTEDERFRRLLPLKRWSREEIQRRLNVQMPQETKIKKADFVIDNNTSLENTEKQVKDILAVVRNKNLKS